MVRDSRCSRITQRKEHRRQQGQRERGSSVCMISAMVSARSLGKRV
jgi:hypothetical protein